LCDQCQQGRFSQQAGSKACNPCPAGLFQDQSGDSSCKACVPGTQMALASCFSCVVCTGCFAQQGSAECVQCAAFRLATRAGSSGCSTCNPNSFSSDDRTRCLCFAGYFAFELTADINGTTTSPVSLDDVEFVLGAQNQSSILCKKCPKGAKW